MVEVQINAEKHNERLGSAQDALKAVMDYVAKDELLNNLVVKYNITQNMNNDDWDKYLRYHWGIIEGVRIINDKNKKHYLQTPKTITAMIVAFCHFGNTFFANSEKINPNKEMLDCLLQLHCKFFWFNLFVQTLSDIGIYNNYQSDSSEYENIAKELKEKFQFIEEKFCQDLSFLLKDYVEKNKTTINNHTKFINISSFHYIYCFINGIHNAICAHYGVIFPNENDNFNDNIADKDTKFIICETIEIR